MQDGQLGDHGHPRPGRQRPDRVEPLQLFIAAPPASGLGARTAPPDTCVRRETGSGPPTDGCGVARRRRHSRGAAGVSRQGEAALNWQQSLPMKVIGHTAGCGTGDPAWAPLYTRSVQHLHPRLAQPGPAWPIHHPRSPPGRSLGSWLGAPINVSPNTHYLQLQW